MNDRNRRSNCRPIRDTTDDIWYPDPFGGPLGGPLGGPIRRPYPRPYPPNYPW